MNKGLSYEIKAVSTIFQYIVFKQCLDLDPDWIRDHSDTVDPVGRPK